MEACTLVWWHIGGIGGCVGLSMGMVARMYDCSAEVAEADGTCSFSSTAYLACASPVDAWSQKNKWEMTG